MSADDLKVIPKRRVLVDPDMPDPPPSPPIQKTIIVGLKSSTMIVQPKKTPKYQDGTRRAYTQRTGNGHKIEKTRDLTDGLRDLIKVTMFLPKNGQIDNDDCVRFKMESSVFNDIAIFQITGYVSVLHTRVAEGVLQVGNLSAYEAWMRTKYGRLWARYNLPIYVEARRTNADLITNGQQPVSPRIARQRQRVAQAAVANSSPETARRIANAVTQVFPGGPVNLMPAFTSFPKRFAGI